MAPPGARPPEVLAHLERTVIGLALAGPTWGPNRLAVQLARQGSAIAPSTVYRTLRRAGLGTRRERLGVLDQHSARQAGLLTERTRERLRRIRRSERHVAASVPGELVCLDCFYIGKLKGVGRVWQITACDAASSYATAHVAVLVQPTAEATARFLREVLVPLYRRAGWPLKRILTGFVERLQGHDPARALARGVPTPLLHPRGAAGSLPAAPPALLQRAAAAPWLPAPGPHTGRARLRSSAMRRTRLSTPLRNWTL